MTTAIVGDIPSPFQAACGILCTVQGFTDELNAGIDLLREANIPTDQIEAIHDAAQALYRQAQALITAVA